MGGGGLGFPALNSNVDAVDIADVGRRLFFSAAIEGFPGMLGGAAPGSRGGAPGGFGAEFIGGRGAELRDVSGSDKYGEWLSAPVSTPPAFRSFGIPPANKPPS